jgi:hypothetical protein
MAIDRTGIDSLDAGAPNLRLEGDIETAQAIPIELQQRILQYWIQQGDGSSADRIEDVPEEFIKEILPLLLSEAPAQGGMEPMSAAQGGRAGYRDGYSVQGGVKNYLGDQETVSGVPVKWQSGPDKPETELAYITKAEKDLILKKDLHGSLKGGPNLGPSGVMSLDSWGDEGGGQAGAEVDSGREEDRPERTQYSPATSRSAQAMSPADVKHAERISGTDYDVFRGQGTNVAGSTQINPKQSLSVFDLIGPTKYVKAAEWVVKKIKEEQEKDFWKKGDDRRTVDIYHDPGGEKHGPEIRGPLYIDPTYSLADAAGTTSDFDLYAALEGREKARFADDQMITSDNRFIGANGGRIPYAYGGVIGSDGRRAYGLGSFVKKAFKKAKRAVKKIAKSPIGKAALLYAGTAGLGHLAAGGGGWGSLNWLKPSTAFGLGKPGWGNLGKIPGYIMQGDPTRMNKEIGLNKLKGFPGLANLSTAAKWGLGIGGLSLYSGLTANGEEDESLDDYIAGRRGPGIDISGIRSEVLERRGTREKYPFLPADYYAVRAQGGRIGAANGGIQGLMPRRGRVMYPGGYKGTTWDEFKQDKSRNADVRPGDKSWRDTYYRWLDINTFGEDKAQGGRIGYAEGTDKGPLYVDPDVTDVPLTNYEKALRKMSKEEREEQLRMLKSILRQRGNIGRDIAIPSGGKTGKERQMELLNWGTNIPDEETGYKDEYSMRHRAAEYLDRPYFDEHYETGEHFNQGGRIGYDEGKLVAGVDTPAIDLEDLPGLLNEFFEVFGRNPTSIDELKRWAVSRETSAQGGRIGYQDGELISNEDEEEALRQKALSSLYTRRLGAQEGGLMDLGGMEKDYRQEGGFVPIGGQEKADDVPARLSKNEFVFTADAVRAAGGGDIDAGAEIMENVMENLEQGGQVSEESQGREGAQNMFATAQRLEGVM